MQWVAAATQQEAVEGQQWMTVEDPQLAVWNKITA